MITSKADGFTLVEILVAVFIYAILATLVMRGLHSSLAAEKVLHQRTEMLAALQRTYFMLEQDVAQMVNRTVLDATGGRRMGFMILVPNEASVGEQVGLKTEQGLNRLEFTTLGHEGVGFVKTSQLLRVAYYTRDHTLYRHAFRQVDVMPTTLVDQLPLVSGLKAIRFFCVDQYGRRQSQWMGEYVLQDQGEGRLPLFGLPRGLVVELEVQDFGTLQWVFNRAVS
jgi:general secretion pathway protein J